MKVTLSRDILVQLIGKVQNVVPVKAVIPILSNILLSAKDGKLTLYVTDLTVSVRSSIDAYVEEEGEIALPAKRFFQLAKELTSSDISIVTENLVATIISGTSFFKLHGMDKNEFPHFPDVEEEVYLSMSALQLKKMLINSAFAAAKDDSRQILNGIFIRIQHGVAIFVGTDGKRLAKIETEIQSPYDQEVSVTIPLKGIEEIVRILDEDETVHIYFMEDKVGISVGNTLLVSKLIAGQFPDYERVIPDRSKMQPIHLHKEELMTLLKQVSLFTSDTSQSVKLTFEDGKLNLEANHHDIGEGKVYMPVDYHHERKEIAFNPYFLLDILRHCKDQTIKFAMTDSFNPGSITDADDVPTKEVERSHFVIMPMRLSNE